MTRRFQFSLRDVLLLVAALVALFLFDAWKRRNAGDDLPPAVHQIDLEIGQPVNPK